MILIVIAIVLAGLAVAAKAKPKTAVPVVSPLRSNDANPVRPDFYPTSKDVRVLANLGGPFVYNPVSFAKVVGTGGGTGAGGGSGSIGGGAGGAGGRGGSAGGRTPTGAYTA